ncbi:hypothetical protein LSUE1_G006192, partial [Lachnellula suecica]
MGSIKPGSALVKLIPWDPESPSHVQRLYDQRVACGWKEERVERWRELQRQGKISLQWIVLAQPSPSLLTAHTTAYPSESTSLLDTPASFGGKPRIATNAEFLPVGHISLDSEYETAEHAEAEEGLYWIATFYISTALQGSGLGRAAMDAVEAMATSEPLNARVLGLSTVAKDGAGRKE